MAWSLRTTCIWCKCGWEHHLYINFSQVKKPRTFKDVRMEAQLHKETNAMLLKQRYKEHIEQRMSEYIEEQRAIKTASILFDDYLKQNSILPINDLYEAYAKICIENEDMCVRADRKRGTTKLENLVRCLTEHLRERYVHNAGIEAGNNTAAKRVNISDIEECKQGLFGLKHFGVELRKSYDAILSGYEHNKDTSFELTGPKFWRTHVKKKSPKSRMAQAMSAAKSAAKHPIKTAAAAYAALPDLRMKDH